MSEAEHVPIIVRPPYADDDPSGGWGVVFLLAILVAVIGLTCWFLFGDF